MATITTLQRNGYDITPDWKFVQVGGQNKSIYFDPSDPTKNFVADGAGDASLQEFVTQNNRMAQVNPEDVPSLLKSTDRAGVYSFTDMVKDPSSTIIDGNRVATSGQTQTPSESQIQSELNLINPDSTRSSGDYGRRSDSTGLLAGVTAPLGSQERSRQLIEAANRALGITTAPTNAGAVNPVGTFNTPQGYPTTPNLSAVNGSVSYYDSLFKSAEKKAADEKVALDKAQSQQDQGTKSFLDRILSSPTPGQTRDQAFSQTGINPQQYFAEEKAQIAEIGKLTEEYNNVLAARDQQIAMAGGKLASNNFINNQIAQINRNAAPELNRLSANINSKVAVLEATQGRFAEAQRFVDQAVQDATADLKYTYDLFNTFYSINQDKINRLDKNYQNALSDARDEAERQFNLAYSEKQQVGDLMLKYRNAGININDSLATATQKASRVSGSGQLTEQIVGGFRVLKDGAGNVISTREISGSDSSTSTRDVDTYANAYLNGEIEVTSIPTEYRAAAIEKANQIATEALNAPTPPTQTQTPSTTGGYNKVGEFLNITVPSFFSNLFGG